MLRVLELLFDSALSSINFDPFCVPCRNVHSFNSLKDGLVVVIEYTRLMIVHRARNRKMEFREISVSQLDTTSICTALIVIQVIHKNRQHKPFRFFCPTLTVTAQSV